VVFTGSGASGLGHEVVSRRSAEYLYWLRFAVTAEGESTPLVQTENRNNVQTGPRSATGAGDVCTAARAITVNEFISKAQTQRQNGFAPSGPEFLAYARHLGINTVADHDLLWIAAESLEAPLPADWSKHNDSEERVFYYNASTRVTTWIHPLEHVHREAYKTVADCRSSHLSLEEKEDKFYCLQQEVEELEASARQETSQWSEHTDKNGNHFYFNREERCSTWTDPRPAFIHSCHLKTKMLQLLKSGPCASFDLAPTKDNDVTRAASNNSGLNSEAGEEAAAAGTCVVCLNASATHVVVPCGHQAFCEECAKNFKSSRRQDCPCCRARITQIIKVYVPGPRQIVPKRPDEEPNQSTVALESEDQNIAHL